MKAPATIIAALLLVVPTILPTLAHAHGGEDHGTAPPPPSATEGVRVAVATTSAVELVLRWPAEGSAKEIPFRVLASDFASNAPIEGASIELAFTGAGDATVMAKATSSPGVYEAPVKLPLDGIYNATATITAGELVDVAAFKKLEIAPAKPAEAVAAVHEGGGPGLWLVLGSLLVLVMLAGIVIARRRRKLAAATLVASALLLSTFARAHGGEDHGDEPKAPPAAPGAGASGAVYFAKESQFLLGVRTEVVAPRAVVDRLRAPGVISAPPEGQAVIVVPQPGKLVAPPRGLPQLGSAVKKGQLLAYVDAVLSATDRANFSSESSQAIATITAAQGKVLAATKNLDRLRSLPALVSQKELDDAEVELKNAQGELDAARGRASAFGNKAGSAQIALVSPIDGILADVSASPGEILEQGRRVFLVLDPKVLWIEARVYEADVARLKPGADASVSVEAYRGRTFKGKLLSQGQVVNEGTRTVKVIFVVDNEESLLKLGMFASVEIGSADAVETLAVPEAAILDVEGRRIVYVHTTPEEFVAKEIAVGKKDGPYYELVEGLKAGDRVVVAGAYSLRNAAAAPR